MVVLAVAQSFEALDGVGEIDELAGRAGEHFGHVEGLRQEALDLAGARYGDLVLFRQLVHAKNGDDVLQGLVALQDLLHAPRHRVVLFPNDQRRKHARSGVEWVDGWIDALLGNAARQYRGGVEMGEGGGRRRIGQIVGRHIDGLDRGDRALLRRGNALLQSAHVGGERRLIAHGRGDAAEQRRYFRACLGEAEDVVDKKQHVLALVTEILGDGEARQADAGAGTWRLIHLAVDERAFRTFRRAVLARVLVHA